MTGQASGLSTATALFFSWSLLTFLVRLWVKLRRTESWSWDDTSISLSLVIIVGQIASTFLAINDGFGSPWSSVSVQSKAAIEKALLAGQILYILSVGLTKISTALFIVRLTRKGQRIRVAYAGAAVCAVWTLASILIVSLRGNLSRPWETIDGTQTLFARWIGIEAAGIVIEVALWALSLNLLWSLNMSLQKRLLVLAIFSTRLVLIPIVAGRLYYLSPSQNFDPTSTSVTAGIYTQAVQDYAFMSASVTCLKPFLRPFHSGYVVSSTNGASSRMNGTGAKERDPYYMLSSVRGKDHDGTLRTSDDGKSEASASKDVEAQVTYIGKSPNEVSKKLRTDMSRHQSTVSTHAAHDSEDMPTKLTKPGKVLDPENMVISKTQAWSVRYEDDEETHNRTFYHAE